MQKAPRQEAQISIPSIGSLRHVPGSDCDGLRVDRNHGVASVGPAIVDDPSAFGDPSSNCYRDARGDRHARCSRKGDR